MSLAWESVPRAPARGTFALGGKSTQKRRSNLRFENPFARLHLPRILTAFATRTLCRGNFTEMLHRHCFSFRCRFCSEMQGFTAMSKTLSNQQPKAAPYLCRFAAKVGGFSRGKGNRNPFPLEWRSLDTFFRQGKKVSRRRQKEKTKKRQRSGQSPAPTHRFPAVVP